VNVKSSEKLTYVGSVDVVDLNVQNATPFLYILHNAEPPESLAKEKVIV